MAGIAKMAGDAGAEGHNVSFSPLLQKASKPTQKQPQKKCCKADFEATLKKWELEACVFQVSTGHGWPSDSSLEAIRHSDVNHICKTFAGSFHELLAAAGRPAFRHLISELSTRRSFQITPSKLDHESFS